MSLPASGQLSLLDIAGEFGGTAPHGLQEYYGAAAGIPGSGPIGIQDFYGVSAFAYDYVENAAVSSTSSVHTYSNRALGAYPTKIVLVALDANTGSRCITGIQIGGVTATLYAGTLATAWENMAIGVVTGLAATTGDVQVTMNNTLASGATTRYSLWSTTLDTIKQGSVTSNNTSATRNIAVNTANDSPALVFGGTSSGGSAGSATATMAGWTERYFFSNNPAVRFGEAQCNSQETLTLRQPSSYGASGFLVLG